MSRATSLYLDLMRFAAAMAVFFFHASQRYISGGLFWQFSGMGQEAVVVFFVLSGFVIAYSCDVKHGDLSDYLVARLARLWSVVLPALLLTVTLDAIGRGWMTDARPLYSAVAPPVPLIGLQTGLNALFVSEIWYLEILPGTDLAFWSLPFEFWYYIAFGVGWFTQGRARAILLLLIVLIAGPRIALLAPAWLIGAVVYYVTRHGAIRPLPGCCLWLGSCAALVLFKQFERPLRQALETVLLGGADVFADQVRMFWPLSYLLACIIAANIIGFNAISHWFGSALRRVAKPIRFLSSLTFAIYLFHQPLVMFFATVAGRQEVTAATTVAIFVGTPAVIVPLSLACDVFKRWLARGLTRASAAMAFGQA
jgi:peptidoglycan/LPS O-acetylase OafA/YrhL